MMNTEVENLKLKSLKEIISLATEVLENIHGYKIPWEINNRGRRFYGRIWRIDSLNSFIKIEYVLSDRVTKTVYKLLETIAHEHAHTKYWDHGVDHTALTQKYLGFIMNEIGYRVNILCKEQITIESVAEKVKTINKIEGKRIPNYKKIFGNGKQTKRVYLEPNNDKDGTLRVRVRGTQINSLGRNGIDEGIVRAIAYYIKNNKECKSNLVFCLVDENKVERILVKNTDKGFKFL